MIDWNLYSRSHPEWFQADGLHPLYGGAVAMATLVHQKLVAAKIAVPAPRVQTKTLPAGRRGAAVFGARPRRRRRGAVHAGRSPGGCRRASTCDRTACSQARRAAIDATGTFTFVVRVKDGSGQAAARKLLLRLRR